jgi:glycosyltransferase involved in cell wall biosynthesis
LKDFDINIIPFKVNKITDSVSPLKLFEYMTNGRPIICTPTRELLKFKDRIFIEEPKNFDKTVRKIIKEHITYVDYGDIIQNHDWEQHARTIENWLGVLDVFPLSPLSTSKVVDILNVNFFDWDGKTVYRGGAERYVLDLCKILKQLDYEPRILQNANFAFERTYEDIKVIGLPAGSNTNVDVLFRYYLNNFAHSDRVICSPLDIACLSTSVKALGINHGMHWDGVTNSLSLHNEARYDIIFNALHTVEKCICVDTNFINWVRTYDYALARKLVYVPNYYDSDQFKPSEKNFANDEIIITYPRRLYAARGFYLVLEAIDRILPSYLNVQFHFVGQVSPPDDADIEKYTHKYPGRVLHYSFDMPEMHKAYEISQIVLIPTVQSEGTSLSCIEAMATNNAIISTDIGGLPNLIIDGFNGLLISPDANELTKAILRLIENRQERIMLARNALQAAPSFSKAKWEARWRKIFADFINK